MAVVVVGEIEGGNQSMYDAVQEKVAPNNKHPEGSLAHIAGPTPRGWRVITVWESEEQFNEFRQEKLIPALQEVGEGDRVAPEIEVNEVYNFVTD